MKLSTIVLILLCLVGTLWAEPERAFEFDYGEVVQPKATKQKVGAIENGAIYYFIRDSKPPVVFMITVIQQGSSLGQETDATMHDWAKTYCEKLTQSLQLELDSVRASRNDRGYSFTFHVKDGGTNYGQVMLGREQTLVFVGLGSGRREFLEFANSFAAKPFQFVRALSRTESAYRVAAGASWACGLANIIAAPLVALACHLLGKSFWLSCRNAFLALGIFEFIGGVAYSLYRWKSLELTGDIAVGALAGLTVTAGFPAGLCQLLHHRLSRWWNWTKKMSLGNWLRR